ncbi:MAG: hypothetical protein ABIQ88_21210 [Chitinophagaceae bacterium]
MKTSLILLAFAILIFSCSTKPKIVVTNVQLEEVKDEEAVNEPPPPPPGHSANVKNSMPLTAPAGMLFSEWLTGICATEHPGNKIIAYNFGIFKTAKWYQVYLTGSKEYSSKDNDWAANQDFIPTFKYFKLSSVDFTNTSFNIVQHKVEEMIKDFMQTAIYQQSFFMKAKAVTIGSDKGDLVKLQ